MPDEKGVPIPGEIGILEDCKVEYMTTERVDMSAEEYKADLKKEFFAGANAFLTECLTSEQRARQLLKFTDDKGLEWAIEKLWRETKEKVSDK